ncbi:hypothetical protein [Arsukibacterium sp.]|uniref:hypothetical protein n=1 Tax=Arsukibacterium sp. TaxID=1977258 RepID=UPI00299D70E2|nr:hypothetical protein [Arsukibacterium sp.]MDX1538729.1 hypothetical protein [Arsukibacterium sp.]
MLRLSILFLLTIIPVMLAAQVRATEAVTLNQASKTPLFDGRCDNDEWKSATKIDLAAEISVYLMHTSDSLFVCAKGKPEDYTVIDIYIENAETGQLHNLHASAQLGERLLKNKEWSASEFWDLKDWGGFWVPYAGNEDTENGTRTKFLEGSHREIQILRRKFLGNSWNMMIGVSAVYHEGEYGAEFFYPDGAMDTDVSTWRRFAFSKSE